MNKAIFVDKDGTLIKNVPYNVDLELIELEPCAGEAMSLLKANDFLLIVISNQSGVADGFFEEENLRDVNEKIQSLLSEFHVKIDAFYYCPHLPDGVIPGYSIECECRKPKPGLLYRAAKDFNVDMGQSWMIGDILNDIEAGNNAGCRTILVDNGNETEWEFTKMRIPHYQVKDLCEASDIILKEEKLKYQPDGNIMEKL